MSICLRPRQNLFAMHSKWRNKLLHLLKRGFRINLLMFILYYFIIYSLSFKVPLETKISEFQYKVLNNIVFTNEKLFKIEVIDSPQCTFCKNEIESLEHFFYNCEITGSFWVVLRSWLMECNINLELLSFFNVL